MKKFFANSPRLCSHGKCESDAEIVCRNRCGNQKNRTTNNAKLNDRIADLRSEMIDAFTRLKDYKSAIEQHIEIINREPENEQLTENAISYVQRYGGAEILLELLSETFRRSV